MWCAYPRCFQERTTHCLSCGRLYCSSHCAHPVREANLVLYECDLCRQHLTPGEARAAHPPGLAESVGAVGLFLLVVAVGVMLDIKAKGSGLVVLWVFALAFLVFATCMNH
jgi:hypothetical protein